MDMDVRKLNSRYAGGKKFYTRASQEEEKCFPAITNNYQYERQRKTETSFRDRSQQETKTTLKQEKKAFRLPRISVKRESFSMCKRCYSHANLCTSSSNNFDSNTSPFNSFATKKVNFHGTVKFAGAAANSRSSQRLLQSLRIVDLNISENKPSFQRENSLRICPMELFPRHTRKAIKSHPVKLSRPELQATYPTLKLAPIDKNAIFALSPSLSLSVESLDSIIGGALTLTQPPPDILSSCSPSEIDFTPPSTP